MIHLSKDVLLPLNIKVRWEVQLIYMTALFILPFLQSSLQSINLLYNVK